MTERDHTPADASFDELAKELAGGTVSRRRALSLAGAALLGVPLGLLPSMPGTEAADKKKRRRRRRKKNGQQPPGSGVLGPSFACQNLFMFCGLGNQTAVCQCRLTKEGTQTCQNVINPPNGVTFPPCQQTIDCPAGQTCESTGNCRTACQTG